MAYSTLTVYVNLVSVLIIWFAFPVCLSPQQKTNSVTQLESGTGFLPLVKNCDMDMLGFYGIGVAMGNSEVNVR
jgi:Flp pilus assembly protein TadG